jgi:hypothetical protein
VRRLWLYARLPWLCVLPSWLHAQFLYLYFLCRAACAPAVAACTLGLALCMPCMAMHSVPPSVLSEPTGMCASCRHACLAWLRVRPVGAHIQFLQLYFPSLAARTLTGSYRLGVALSTHCMATRTVPASLLFGPSYIRAWLGFVYAGYGYPHSASGCIF